MNSLDLFNIWNPVDSLKTIYKTAEELAKRRKTSVDEVFEKANFDPLAFQMTLTGADSESVKKYEGLVLDRLNRKNTITGKVKDFFGFDPWNAPKVYISKGVSPVDANEHEHLRQNVDALVPDSALVSAEQEKDEHLFGVSRNAYVNSFLDKIKKNKKKIAGAAFLSLLLGGAAFYSISNCMEQGSHAQATACKLETSNLINGFSYNVKELMKDIRGTATLSFSASGYTSQDQPQQTSIECGAGVLNLVGDFDASVKETMKDLKISEEEIRDLNQRSGTILSCVEGKDIKDIQVASSIQMDQISDIMNAYIAHYKIDPADQAKMQETKLLPEHADTFLKWFESLDKSRLDTETQIRFDLIHNDMLVQKQNNTLDLYDVVEVSEFIESKYNSIAEEMYRNLEADLQKIKHVNEATAVDIKYMDSTVLPSDKTEATENFATPDVLSQDYYNNFPATVKLTSEQKIKLENGTEVTVTERPITPAERQLEFLFREEPLWWYEGIWAVASLCLAPTIRYISDRSSCGEFTSGSYLIAGLFSGPVIGLAYDIPQTAGTQADLYNSIIVHSVPLYGLAFLHGMANRFSRWSAKSRREYCGTMSRAQV